MKKIISIECLGESSKVILGRAKIRKSNWFRTKEVTYDFYIDLFDKERRSYGSCHDVHTGSSSMDTQGLSNMLIYMYENNMKLYTI